MLATPAISSTPLHNARLHTRPPGGIEPQVLPQLERTARQSDRARLQRVTAIEPAGAARAGGPRNAGGADGLAGPQDRTPGGRAVSGEGDAGNRSRGAHADAAAPGASRADPSGLDPAARAEVERLAKRDRAVRAHEAAHVRAGGRYAGSPSYDFVRGPDGKRYAVGGRVRIDISTDPSDPEETIRKMEVVKRAALAPIDPSPADRRVAAMAERLARAAEADLTAARLAEREIVSAAHSDRLTRLAILFARTSVLPSPEPSVSRGF